MHNKWQELPWVQGTVRNCWIYTASTHLLIFSVKITYTIGNLIFPITPVSLVPGPGVQLNFIWGVLAQWVCDMVSCLLFLCVCFLNAWMQKLQNDLAHCANGIGSNIIEQIWETFKALHIGIADFSYSKRSLVTFPPIRRCTYVNFGNKLILRYCFHCSQVPVFLLKTMMKVPKHSTRYKWTWHIVIFLWSPIQVPVRF